MANLIPDQDLEYYLSPDPQLLQKLNQDRVKTQCSGTRWQMLSRLKGVCVAKLHNADAAKCGEGNGCGEMRRNAAHFWRILGLLGPF